MHVQKEVRLDRSKILHIAEKMAIKKYGGTISNARNKFKEKIGKFIKSEQFVYDLDSITAVEVSVFAEIIGEFKSFISM